MSLRLTNPGTPAAMVYPAKHSMAGQPIEPIGYLRDGSPVWPMFGAAPDDEDPDDPSFTGEDDDTEDDDDSDDDDEKLPKGKRKRRVRKPNRPRDDADDDEDDDDDEDEDDELPPRARASRQAMRYRRELRDTQKLLADMRKELKGYRDKDKKPEELSAEELAEAKEKATRLAARQERLALENAFLRSNLIDWVDPDDALRLVDLSDVDVDEDGTVDRRALRAALKDLAKRKPHLVKKAKVSDQDDDEDDDTDDDDEPRSTRPARMNGRRKGERKNSSKQDLASRFPVLNRL